MTKNSTVHVPRNEHLMEWNALYISGISRGTEWTYLQLDLYLSLVLAELQQMLLEQ